MKFVGISSSFVRRVILIADNCGPIPWCFGNEASRVGIPRGWWSRLLITSTTFVSPPPFWKRLRPWKLIYVFGFRFRLLKLNLIFPLSHFMSSCILLLLTWNFNKIWKNRADTKCDYFKIFNILEVFSFVEQNNIIRMQNGYN